MTPPARSRRGLFWVVGQMLLLVGVTTAPWMQRGQPTTWGRWTALGCFALSGILGLTAARALGRGLTPFPAPRADAKLVTHGIYSTMRHPMYTCLALAGWGWSIWWNSLATFAATLVLFLFLNAKARFEERELSARFPDYADYAARTRRFLPGLW